MTPTADDYRNLADGIEESKMVSGAASSWWAGIATALRSAAEDREKLERLEGALTEALDAWEEDEGALDGEFRISSDGPNPAFERIAELRKMLGGHK